MGHHAAADQHRRGAADTVGPEQPMRPSTICQTPVCSRQATSPTRAAWRLLDLEAARPLATGAGVTVALIDTGVTPIRGWRTCAGRGLHH
ncbi:peptidase S8 and S53, subtilisin, kexin, sedolisin domain protein [Mycobacterium xenopi 4042]|uniref:Peptidase S8 and S53, subtilisin, kexin, sedolisin domain protein n=1 Tax=Mycobacterium xenopi 4042 TaxID=1299334 RepID=X8A216_MYCXE|nr:peptidase S8 and S53, subtilisin, kexin, sedolisin domain protein [Mycobacterium xenopi 4042]